MNLKLIYFVLRGDTIGFDSLIAASHKLNTLRSGTDIYFAEIYTAHILMVFFIFV